MNIIIIGATSGIGRELAKLYAATGHRLGITGRRQELLESFQREFQATSFIATACFDVTGSENILHLEGLIDKLGGMDLLIYNSGFGDPSPELEWEIDKKTVGINVNGFIEIVNWSFRYCIKQGHGHIAATSSVASNRGNSFAPAYSASKAFISTYLEGLYIKSKRMGLPVFITDIQPGFVRTKEINVKGQFWVVPVKKAARQIFESINSKQFRAYVSRRWWLVAKLMRAAPGFLYSKIG
jgi:short-subunit dehydrogenase